MYQTKHHLVVFSSHRNIPIVIVPVVIPKLSPCDPHVIPRSTRHWSDPGDRASFIIRCFAPPSSCTLGSMPRWPGGWGTPKGPKKKTGETPWCWIVCPGFSKSSQIWGQENQPKWVDATSSVHLQARRAWSHSDLDQAQAPCSQFKAGPLIKSFKEWGNDGKWIKTYVCWDWHGKLKIDLHPHTHRHQSALWATNCKGWKKRQASYIESWTTSQLLVIHHHELSIISVSRPMFLPPTETARLRPLRFQKYQNSPRRTLDLGSRMRSSQWLSWQLIITWIPSKLMWCTR